MKWQYSWLNINQYKRNRSEAKRIRDQAYTHLKEVVDEIRFTGQYVFRQNKDRFVGYRSKHIRQLTIKQKGKPKKKKKKNGAGE